MTQEEKAQAYDKVREKIAIRFGSNVADEIFSQFEMSEDEKIRKALIDGFKRFDCSIWQGIDIKRILTWLEKQGEQKETACDRCRKAQPNGSCQDITALGRCCIEGERKAKDTTVICHESGLKALKALEKSLEKGCTEGEQKSADKVEPKFRVGDWVIYVCGEDSATLQIKNIVYGTYEFTDDSTLNVVDEDTLRLWTIQDAKDGDVLVDVYGNIGIFEKRYRTNWHTYCYLGNEGRLFPVGGSHGSICYPATKEQRDTLMKAMKEAGYEWDAEKKELKKIKQKSAWSEEDEINYNYALAACIYYGEAKGYADTETHQKTIDWLKSLKDRYTWKPSDEQMKALDDFIYAKYPNIKKYGVAIKSLFQDLKKLREE